MIVTIKSKALLKDVLIGFCFLFFLIVPTPTLISRVSISRRQTRTHPFPNHWEGSNSGEETLVYEFKRKKESMDVHSNLVENWWKITGAFRQRQINVTVLCLQLVSVDSLWHTSFINEQAKQPT